MLVKKLISGCKWISCIDVHPSGDHLIVGSYDRRVAWFDLDLSSTPYKTLKYHTKVTWYSSADIICGEATLDRTTSSVIFVVSPLSDSLNDCLSHSPTPA